MTENLLIKYMQSRFLEPQRIETCSPNPFITISREFGCPSKLIAQMLADTLNIRQGKDIMLKWQCINKEIVEESARMLELDPAKIKYIFGAEEKGIIDDVLASFSSNYRSSQRIKKTIEKVILSFAQKGFVILVGRGGVAITRHCPNSLHIRLQAPVAWRINEVSLHKNLSSGEALKLIHETDKKRRALIEIFLGNNLENTMFDLIFNCKTITKILANEVSNLPDDLVRSCSERSYIVIANLLDLARGRKESIIYS
jgi:cytidylate kinase